MKINIKVIIVSLSIGLMAVFFVINYFQTYVDDELKKDELYQFGEKVNEQLSGTKVPDVVCLDTLGKPFKLSNLITKKSLLIYCYSEFNCSSCYEKDLNTLQKVSYATPFSAIVLSEYMEYRYFKVYQKQNPCKLPAFRIEHKAFDWILENSGVSYFFVLNSDMTASYFFIPNPNNPEVTRKYLEKVQKMIHN